MAYPTKPTIEYSYTGFEAEQQGISAFPGSELDNDLAELEQSDSDIIDFISGVIRSDGALQNGIVTQASLSSEILIGVRPPTVWATATMYTKYDTVFTDNSVWEATVGHVSGASFAADEALGLWIEIMHFTGIGNMEASVYDPTGVADDAFARANHTGTQAMSTIVGLEDALADTSNTPERYGATGNGVANDTTAVLAAIASGKEIYLENDYRITAGLTLSTSYQRIGGPGRLTVVGSFNAITVAGGAIGVEVDVNLLCAGQTGGFAINVSNASRARIRKCYIADSGHSGINVQQANSTTIDWFFAILLRGAYGIRYYGTGALRSDGLVIVSGTCSFFAGAQGVGLEWDGNANNLVVLAFTVVGVAATNALYHGIRIWNTSGGPTPISGRFGGIYIDLPYVDGVAILAGDDIEFESPYINGSQTASGFFVAASGVGSDTVRISGGKSQGNALYGLSSTGARVLEVNFYKAFNVTADYAPGTLSATLMQRWVIDANFYAGISSSVPFVQWDANDYTAYDRTGNVLTDYINSVAIWNVLLDRVQAGVPVELAVYAKAALPSAARANQMIQVSDEAGGTVPCFSDGTNWRRVTDRAIVS